MSTFFNEITPSWEKWAPRMSTWTDKILIFHLKSLPFHKTHNIRASFQTLIFVLRVMRGDKKKIKLVEGPRRPWWILEECTLKIVNISAHACYKLFEHNLGLAGDEYINSITILKVGMLMIFFFSTNIFDASRLIMRHLSRSRSRSWFIKHKWIFSHPTIKFLFSSHDIPLQALKKIHKNPLKVAALVKRSTVNLIATELFIFLRY